MFTNGISAFANSLSIWAEAIKEATDLYYITLQNAPRYDWEAIRKIEEEEEQERWLQQRFLNRTLNPYIGQNLDIYA